MRGLLLNLEVLVLRSTLIAFDAHYRNNPFFRSQEPCGAWVIREEEEVAHCGGQRYEASYDHQP